ncbi:MAG: translocation/assembly module TamB domain-containing protein [Pseudomonadota bacterium]|nr:translocation/assembly module TamB domain-containing protein [Pseudomonadota bacterium]
MSAALLGAAVALVILGAAAWVFGSENGSRWLVGRLLGMIPARVETGRIEGALGGELSVADLRVRGEGWCLTARRTVVRWRPWELWAGKVFLGRLILDGLEFQDRRPARPLDLTWPRLPGCLAWFRGGIDALEIRNLVWKNADREIAMPRLTLALDYAYGLTSLSDFVASVPGGRLSGRLQFHLARPFLETRLKFVPDEGPRHETTLRASLRASSDSLHLQGPVALVIADGQRERYIFNGHVATSGHVLNLTGLSGEERGRSGSVQGEACLDFSRPSPRLSSTLRLHRLDLSPEVGRELVLAGDLEFAGNLSSYEGRFRLLPHVAVGPSLAIQGGFSGSGERMAIDGLRIDVGQGIVRGRAVVARDGGWTVSWALQARNMDPSLAIPRVRGVVNADFDGFWRLTAGGKGSGRLTGRFLESRLSGRQMTGGVGMRWEEDLLLLDNLEVRGEGFQARARGDLRERVGFEVRIASLAHLMPEADGRLQGRGWVRYRHRLLSGALNAAGKKITWGQGRIDELALSLSLGEGDAEELRAQIQAKDLRLAGQCLQGELTATGTRKRQELNLRLSTPEGGLTAKATGAYDGGVWRGAVGAVTVDGKSAGVLQLSRPAALSVSPGLLRVEDFVMAGPSGERLEISAHLGDRKQPGYARMSWRDFQLDRLPSPVDHMRWHGRTTGRLRVEQRRVREGFQAEGEARLQGRIVQGERSLDLREGKLRFQWQTKGLDAGGSLDLGPMGRLTARLSSGAAPFPSFPESGTYEATLVDLDVGLLNPLLPSSLRAEGALSGHLDGSFLPRRRFAMNGRAEVVRGAWTVVGRRGTTRLVQERLALAWAWRDDVLQGTMEGAFADHGRLRTVFSLPVRSRYPLGINPQDAISASVKGEVREKGILGAIFPGTVRETHGRLAIDLAVAGAWNKPRYEGRLRLLKAGAYVTGTGIRLRDVEAEARLFPERVEIEGFSVCSGPGCLKGRATIRHGGGKVREIKGHLEGERFQAAYLPELRLLVSPRIVFEGTTERLTVRGALQVPEGRYAEPRDPGLIGASKDVKIIDKPEKKTPAAPFALDMDLTITLGEQVHIKTRDIEGNLSGEMNARGKNREDLQTRGEIHITQGYLHAANTKLPIERGHIHFKDKPFSQADLDILAVKTVGDVRAGFLVTGTLREPVVTLYSVPSLPDQDVLAYIVFGTSYTGEKIQAATLLKAAGMFLAQGKAGGLEDSLRRSAGLEVGGITAPSRSKQGRTDMTTSLSTLGQYLSPRLYVGLARAMFSDDILYVMKYSFSRRWEVETKAGRQSSIDLFYKLEFD